MSRLYLNHKKIFIASIILILSVVLVTSLAIYFVAINSEKTPIAIDENGNELISGKVYDMPSNLMFTSNVEEVSDNDGILLKATVKPDVAYNKTLDWTVAFIGNGSWSSGKQVSDYLTVTPTSDGSDTATVKCLQAFGQAIEIQVTSRSNPNAKTSCKVDYMSRVSAVNFSFDYTDEYSYLSMTFPKTGGEVDMPAPNPALGNDKYNGFFLEGTLGMDIDNYNYDLGIGTKDPTTGLPIPKVYGRWLPNALSALTKAGVSGVSDEFKLLTFNNGATDKYYLNTGVFLTGMIGMYKDSITSMNESIFYKPWAALSGVTGNQFELRFDFIKDGVTQSVIHQYRFSVNSRVYAVESVVIDNSTIIF